MDDADAGIQETALAAIVSGVPLLRAFREYRDFDIADLSAAARVPAADIENAETGGALSFDYLCSLADALRIPAEMLLWHAARADDVAAEESVASIAAE